MYTFEDSTICIKGMYTFEDSTICIKGMYTFEDSTICIKGMYRILRTIGRYFFSSTRWLRPIVHIDLYKDEF
jgi:hypothetical protein